MVVVGIILALTNLLVIGCMHVAFAGYGKYKEHMILGVTFSEEQIEDEEIQQLVAKYKRFFGLILWLVISREF